jgi:hypothetical protein
MNVEASNYGFQHRDPQPLFLIDSRAAALNQDNLLKRHGNALKVVPTYRRRQLRTFVQIASRAHPVSYRTGTGNMKLATHLHLVPRLRTCGAVPPHPIRMHGVVL